MVLLVSYIENFKHVQEFLTIWNQKAIKHLIRYVLSNFFPVHIRVWTYSQGNCFCEIFNVVLLEFFNIQARRRRKKNGRGARLVRNTNIDSCLSSSLLLFLFDVEQGELIKNHIEVLGLKNRNINSFAN